MRKIVLFSSAVSAFALTAPAHAAVIVNSADAVGTEYVVDFIGHVGGASTPLISSLLTLTFNGVSNGGATFNFGYTLLNDSAVNSNLRSFGFDVIGGSLMGATATGSMPFVGLNNNFPEGRGKLDICFRSNSNGNCTGGGGGFATGETAIGSIALKFNDLPGSIALDKITTRYQSIAPSINGSDSGIGIPGAVPEPSTWALMILGFGTVGMALRRRREKTTIAYS